MLTQEQRDRLEVVLVSPRNPLNIGAVARAMANFSFSRLTVVAPYEPHWREARSAVGAPDLLLHAREAATVAEFAADDDVEDLKASGARLAHKYLAEAAPAIEPAAVEVPVSGSIAGVPVRGIIDIIEGEGRVIDIKTTSRKPSKISGDHAFQLATYVALLGDGGSGEARLDSLVATKDPQLIQIEHSSGESGGKLVERMYPLVAEGIAGGLYLPNRSSSVCSRRYCSFADACELEFGGVVE